ncbi:hypothetical protein V2U99_18950 [Klebsiella variicola]
MLEALYLPLRMWLNTLLFLNQLFTKNKKCIKTKTDALWSRLYAAVSGAAITTIVIHLLWEKAMEDFW